MIGPTDVLPPPPASHVITFQVFLFYFSKYPSFNATQSYAPVAALY